MQNNSVFSPGVSGASKAIQKQLQAASFVGSCEGFMFASVIATAFEVAGNFKRNKIGKALFSTCYGAVPLLLYLGSLKQGRSYDNVHRCMTMSIACSALNIARIGYENLPIMINNNKQKQVHVHCK